MAPLKLASDSVVWFLSELCSRVVAESGIPSDKYHLGKLILQSLKDAPYFVMQVDAATGQSEIFKSVLERSVRCACAFRKLGLKTGDNIVLMAPNHLDVTIPFYAALYLGIGTAAIDANLSVAELEVMFKINEAKVVFCQNERTPFIKKALMNTRMDATVITFDDSDNCITFSNFMEKYGGKADVKQFKAADFDPSETIAMLICTSGTTGMPKAAANTHANFFITMPHGCGPFNTFPTPTRLTLVTAPLQWLSATYHYVFSAILRYTRLQSSAPLTPANYVEIVNKYRPTYTTISPTLLTMLTKPQGDVVCDITCFEVIMLGGSAISQEHLESLRKISPNTRFHRMYGMSEVGLAFYDDNPPPGSLGRPVGLFDYRLVDPETNEDVMEPNKTGELWLRGPSISKGYYNNPEANKEVFAEGGWFKTGDLFYRDEHFFFYYVDRLKLLLKYLSRQISPIELESVITQHPGVLDVAVTSVPDERGDLAVACVAPKSGYIISAQEIKDLVKKTLPEYKQLHGGVVFMDTLPMTASTKVHRQQLKQMVLTLNRE